MLRHRALPWFVKAACVTTLAVRGACPDDSRMGELRRFDSRPFTLHEHCGRHAAAVGRCLRQFDVADTDDGNPFAGQSGEGASACRSAWDTYRRCGYDFITAVEWAPRRCHQEMEAFRTCERAKTSDCAELELALLKCAATRIVRVMSGQEVPFERPHKDRAAQS